MPSITIHIDEYAYALPDDPGFFETEGGITIPNKKIIKIVAPDITVDCFSSGGTQTDTLTYNFSSDYADGVIVTYDNGREYSTTDDIPYLNEHRGEIMYLGDYFPENDVDYFEINFYGDFTFYYEELDPIKNLKVGSNQVQKIFLGSKEIEKMYQGGTCVWNPYPLGVLQSPSFGGWTDPGVVGKTGYLSISNPNNYEVECYYADGSSSTPDLNRFNKAGNIPAKGSINTSYYISSPGPYSFYRYSFLRHNAGKDSAITNRYASGNAIAPIYLRLTSSDVVVTKRNREMITQNMYSYTATVRVHNPNSRTVTVNIESQTRSLGPGASTNFSLSHTEWSNKWITLTGSCYLTNDIDIQSPTVSFTWS